jgi:hypothetical protein
MALASALDCQLSASLVSQDPYPAIPGDYVKVVFQVNGLDNSECGNVDITLLPSYPFTLDPGEKSTYSSGSFFAKDYSSFVTLPFKLRIDNEALDGDNQIELSLRYEKGGYQLNSLKKFNISIEDARTDFEVFVKNYDFTTNTLTFEVLNSGKNDVKAVTLKVLDGVRTQLKGADTNIIGDLDSNEYTTADFLVSPLTTKIPISITYTDSIDVRRTVEKSVEFNPANFEGVGAKKGLSGWMIALIVVVVLVVAWFVYKRFIKRK